MLRWRQPEFSPSKLSDSVISGLRLRAERSEAFVVAPPASAPSLPSFGAFATSVALPEATSLTSSHGRKNDVSLMRSPEAFQKPRTNEDSPVPIKQAEGEQPPPKPKKKRIRIKTERRREQCRANQARYRNKQRTMRLKLNKALALLRKEVRELELHRRSLTYGRHAKLSPWGIVVDFIRHLARDPGVLLHPTADFMKPGGDESASAAVSSDDQHAEDHRKFLRLALASDAHLVGSASHGATALLEQWSRWSDCLGRYEIQLMRIEQVNGQPHSITATTCVIVELCGSNLGRLFPSLTDEYADSVDLARRLYGRRVAFELVMHFDHDPITSVITRLCVEMDTIWPLAQILGSLVDAARLLVNSPLRTTAFLGYEANESMPMDESEAGGKDRIML